MRCPLARNLGMLPEILHVQYFLYGVLRTCTKSWFTLGTASRVTFPPLLLRRNKQKVGLLRKFPLRILLHIWWHRFSPVQCTGLETFCSALTTPPVWLVVLLLACPTKMPPPPYGSRSRCQSFGAYGARARSLSPSWMTQRNQEHRRWRYRTIYHDLVNADEPARPLDFVARSGLPVKLIELIVHLGHVRFHVVVIEDLGVPATRGKRGQRGCRRQ
jgi:hypothetical protein